MFFTRVREVKFEDALALLVVFLDRWLVAFLGAASY